MNEGVPKRVVVDAGHGGSDPGAVNGNVYEKDFTLAVSKYIYDRLKELGVPVYITRTTDETLDRDERVRRILSAFGNNKDVILLSNHINAGGGEGAEVVYALRNSDTLARKVLDSIGEEGQKKRKIYQKRYPTDASKDYYFIHRLTGNVEPLLIEYGFIDNSKDLAKLQKDLLNYGEGVVRAVTDYIGVPYNAPSTIDSNIYVVQKGDTLYGIASKLNTTVPELKAANNLTSNLISVGQKLKIPTSIVEPPSNDLTVYVVEKGDTLYSISKRFGVSVDKLIDANQLSTTTLSVGQKILIPTDVEEIEKIENYYIVSPGDTLYSLANKYNTTIDQIITLNNLKSTILEVGDKLIIPNYSSVIDDDNETEYIVQRGDTLYSIANKFDTSVSKIKDLNNLTSNILVVGQKLKIPTISKNMVYYVSPGDTLYSIATRFNTTVNELRRINNLNSDILYIGQVLQLQ